MKGNLQNYNDNTDAFSIIGEDGRTYYALANEYLLTLNKNEQIEFNYKVINPGKFETLVVTDVVQKKDGISYTLKSKN